MIASGSIAFANARVRALKSRLLGREIAGRMSAGLAITRDRSTDPADGFRELLEWYAVALKSYPYGQPLLMALLRRFEIENIKLVWRAVLNRVDQARWTPRWVALDRLATVRLESCRDLHTLPALVDALRRTPYATIASAMWRAHAQDALAAEMGFDRWASRAIVEQTAQLRGDDATTAALALAVVHERDLNVIRRLTAAGVPPDVVAGALAAAPARRSRPLPPIVDWDRRLIFERRERRALCRRAFLESPFCLAPAVALLLLKEEEVRGLEALAAIDDGAAPAAFDYALAASELGA